MSFVELFKDLEKYIDEPKSRWAFSLRVKRGMIDTSQRGGLYKDVCYLEGIIAVLSQRKTLNFKGLLCGKISLHDIKRPEISVLLNYNGQLLPEYLEDMDEYMRCLDIIAKTNFIDTIDESIIQQNNFTGFPPLRKNAVLAISEKNLPKASALMDRQINYIDN